jgi:uncharacterized membrane protein YdjX (TVP38/TMEM64 family)
MHFQKRWQGIPVAVRLMVLIVIVAISIACIMLLPKGFVTDAIAWIRGLGPWGPIVLACLYIPESMLMIPGFLLTLGAGFLFGVIWGTAAASIGSVAGATVAFILGRTLGRAFVERRMAKHPKFAAIDRVVAERGFKIVLLIRLSPIIPFNLTNYLFGLTQVTLKDYVLASWLGMFPATLTYAYFGSLAKNLRELPKAEGKDAYLETALFVIGLVATVVVTVYITRIAQRELKQTMDDAHDAEEKEYKPPRE